MPKNTSVILSLIRQYREVTGNGKSFGNLSKVLDDGFIRDADVQDGINLARLAGDLSGVVIGGRLLEVSWRQRLEIWEVLNRVNDETI